MLRISTHSDDVVAWRRRRLAAAGFDRRTAAALARDCAYDLHQLIELVGHGCPPQLALRIAAPDGSRPC